MGQPFLVNLPAKFSNVWFGANERIIALTFTVVAEAMGTIVGFKMPVAFVKNEDTKDEFEVNVVKSLAL